MVCVQDDTLIFLRPGVYMNESGGSVKLALKKFDVRDPGRVLVIHDELSLPFGRVRIKVRTRMCHLWVEPALVMAVLTAFFCHVRPVGVLEGIMASDPPLQHSKPIPSLAFKLVRCRSLR